jgi:hypothetical protein
MLMNFNKIYFKLQIQNLVQKHEIYGIFVINPTKGNVINVLRKILSQNTLK